MKNFSYRMFYVVCLVSLAMIAFVACGDDVSTETQTLNDEKGMTIVSDIADLPECGKGNDGEQVFVKNEKSIRICSKGEWFGTINGTSSVDTVRSPSKCFSVSLADSSGVKIICDGDSVGVVLHGHDGTDGSKGSDGEKGLQGIKGEMGADGTDGKNCDVAALPSNDGLKVICNGDSVGIVLNGTNGENGSESVSNCSIIDVDCVLNISCGKDTVSLGIESSENSCMADVSLDQEAVAVNLEGIGGQSQKGPFLKGSEVIAYELLNGRSLQQTGKTFQGKILSDSGNFNIKTVSLASQYATLMAKGYYLNEVTGNPSKSQITLTALTNLRGRSVANINLLTHLENERAQFLVIEGKMTVQNAKKKAEGEVFKLFHIDASNFTGYSEDLNISGTTDADAALLAISILLQGDRSEAELTALLTAISSAMEETGKWNDLNTKISIADWAATIDSAGLLPQIRNHVEKWGLTEHAANFEPYIRNYWYMELGLGPCTAEKVGTVAELSAGIRKGTNNRYTCVDSSDTKVGKVWRISTDLEKDTYGWNPGVDGQKEIGHYNQDKYYIYDKTFEAWRDADNREIEWGGCIENREGEFYQLDDLWWICKSRKWTEISGVEIDTEGWKVGKDGEVKKGNSDEYYYVYDVEEKQWRNASDLDVALGSGCTTNRVGEMITASEKNSPCDGRFFVCQKNHDWKETVNQIEINTYERSCDKDGKMVNGLFNPDMWYVCENIKWRDATTSEESKMFACLSSMVDSVTFFGGDGYVCRENHEWKTAEFYDYAIGEKDFFSSYKDAKYIDTLFVDPRDGKLYKLVNVKFSNYGKDYDKVWFAENLRFADSTTYVNMKGQSWCYKERNGDCTIGGRYYTWTAAMNVLPRYQSGNVSDVPGLIRSPHQGLCPAGWHIPSAEEWQTYLDASGYYNYHLASPGFVPHETGYYDSSKKVFVNVGSRQYFWAASSPYGWGFTCYWDGCVIDNADVRHNGFPVRCVQD